MTAEERQPGNEDKSSPEREKSAEQAAEDAGDDSCRCKEVSRKTIPGMLKLMLKDLAFWRKGR